MMRLRLFPLHTVLFPGMPLTLQVFEERYRYLVSECLASGEPFGVALIREGPEVGGEAVPHDVGTTARVERVTPAGADRLMLQSRGVARFRVTRLHHDRAYLSADVEYPVDEQPEVPETLYEEAARGYEQIHRLLHTIEGGYQRTIPIPQSPSALADAIGAIGSGVLPTDRMQALLEILSVPRRLERALEVVNVVLEATHARAQQVVAERWGAVERRN
jgi:uncharacterized protein